MSCNSSTPNQWLVQSNSWISPSNIGAIIWHNFCSLPMHKPECYQFNGTFPCRLKAPHFPFLWYIILPHKLSILHAITFFYHYQSYPNGNQQLPKITSAVSVLWLFVQHNRKTEKQKHVVKDTVSLQVSLMAQSALVRLGIAYIILFPLILTSTHPLGWLLNFPGMAHIDSP